MLPVTWWVGKDGWNRARLFSHCSGNLMQLSLWPNVISSARTVTIRSFPFSPDRGDAMMKTCTALAAAAAISIAAIAAPTSASARDGAVAAGVIGGLAAGAIIGSAAANANGYYAYGPGPVYYAPGPRCYMTRQRV